MANELALPTSYEEINNLAKAFVQSGYFADTKQLAQAIVKIQAGKELSLPPVFSIQNINLIRGRLTSSANTLALLVKRSGRYNYRIKEHTDTVCAITFYEMDGGKWVEVGESKFTMDDARRADLVKPDSGWAKYPRAMLFSRAISQGARIYAPDAIGGVYTDEEIRAIPPRPGDSETVIAEPDTGEVVTPKQPMKPETRYAAMQAAVNKAAETVSNALEPRQNGQGEALPAKQAESTKAQDGTLPAALIFKPEPAGHKPCASFGDLLNACYTELKLMKMAVIKASGKTEAELLAPGVDYEKVYQAIKAK
jgi:hypothetical protein